MSEFESSNKISDEDDGLTMEERVSWLRQRGVQVEIPGEAPETAVTGSESVVVVRIPADESLPYEEVTIDGFTLQSRGDELPQKLRKYFASSSKDINTDLLKESAAKHFGNQQISISPESLQKVSGLGHVETFSLDSPSDANELQGVNIYLDEAGQLKGLKTNTRASQLARQCGYLNVPFVGDVFVGRTAIKKGGKTASVGNTSFLLKDLDSSSPWMRGAETRNYELGVSRGQVSMDGGGAPDEDCIEGHDEERGIVWTESQENCEVQFTFPNGNKYTSKQFTVKFSTKELTVSLKPGVVTDPNIPVELLHLKLAGKIAPDDCTWTVSGLLLSLYLEKSPPKLWQKLEE